MGAALTGVGTALPAKVLDNAELAQMLDVTEEWIFSRTGIRERRIASDSDSASSLATASGSMALDASGVAASDLDFVIVATCTPDYSIPATGPLVAAALGAKGAAAFDLNACCAGFLYGLAQATALIESGTAEKVLLCGTDLLSRNTDYTDPKTAILFGDGAGAVVVERIEGETRLGPFRLRADGSRPELLWIPPEKGLIEMEGREVYRNAVEAMTTSVRDILESARMSADDVDLLVAHQANARILRAVAERLAFPEERVMTNIARVGNTSGASIPLALGDAQASGMLVDDARVVLTAFGAGFAWGAGLVRWGAGVEVEEPLVLTGDARA
jgi:3-oxoacyl-[acyl-carrier-protein] synthase-3